MKIFLRLASIGLLVLLLVLVMVPSASAYESRGGDVVIVDAGEVIEDDLYVSAEKFVLDGTIKGDLLVTARHVIINGVLEGDLMAAAQDITIHGEVKDDARMVGAVIILTKKARVGGDLMAMSYSLEMKKGSVVEGSLLGAGAQAFFGGEIAKGLTYGAGGVAIEGKVGKDVKVDVGSPEDSAPMNISQFFTGLPAMPSVKGGLTIGEGAKIDGHLTYTAPKPAQIPANVIRGEATHLLPKLDTDVPSQDTAGMPQAMAVSWALGTLRLLITLLIIGLLLIWLVPTAIQRPLETLISKPLPSLGHGALGYLIFWVALGLLIIVLILITILFGALTLGGLSAGVFFTGLGGLIILVTFFLLIAAYVTKLIVGFWAGRWILSKVKPDSVENPYATMVVGVIVLVLLVSIPFLGTLLKIAVTCFGLGAMLILAKQWIKRGDAKEMVAIA